MKAGLHAWCWEDGEISFIWLLFVFKNWEIKNYQLRIKVQKNKTEAEECGKCWENSEDGRFGKNKQTKQ